MAARGMPCKRLSLYVSRLCPSSILAPAKIYKNRTHPGGRTITTRHVDEPCTERTCSPTTSLENGRASLWSAMTTHLQALEAAYRRPSRRGSLRSSRRPNRMYLHGSGTMSGRGAMEPRAAGRMSSHRLRTRSPNPSGERSTSCTTWSKLKSRTRRKISRYLTLVLTLSWNSEARLRLRARFNLSRLARARFGVPDHPQQDSSSLLHPLLQVIWMVPTPHSRFLPNPPHQPQLQASILLPLRPRHGPPHFSPSPPRPRLQTPRTPRCQSRVCRGRTRFMILRRTSSLRRARRG
ncbi:hypothetical protein B0H19DRAFT_1135099 [Mycena capillaripes]|nr:hypothetical protein B0H19DRAFT_1135099 [Mycena capillaripes]